MRSTSNSGESQLERLKLADSPRRLASTTHSGHQPHTLSDHPAMKKPLIAFAAIALVASPLLIRAEEKKAEPKPVTAPLSFTMKSLEGQEVDLSKYKGKVVLIVNTASECGLTPQYKELQETYTKYKDKDFVVLGFPCNQFNGQEPGDAKEIGAFCTKNYGVTFPMFAKVEVNGDNATPLYKLLTSTDAKPTGKGKISWNFEKFLIGRNGEVAARFAPRTKPDDAKVTEAIENAIASK
jgi:glutathione peroxidase